jgi:hypothetical protein
MCQRFNYLPLIFETGNTWKHLVTSRDTFPTNFNLWLQKVFSFRMAQWWHVAPWPNPTGPWWLHPESTVTPAATIPLAGTFVIGSHHSVAQLPSMGERTMGERIICLLTTTYHI